MTIQPEFHVLKKEDQSPYTSVVYMWCMSNILERPEMRRDGTWAEGLDRLMDNIYTDRIEVFIKVDGELKGGMIFTEEGYDMHFGKSAALLGSWMEDKTYSKRLYKYALQVLKIRGHKSMLRTMRLDESSYKTIYKEI